MTGIEGVFVRLPLARLALATYDSYFNKWGWMRGDRENVGADFKPVDTEKEIKLSYTKDSLQVELMGRPSYKGSYRGYDIKLGDLPAAMKVPESLQQKMQEYSK